ncbi:hypothetical protein [Hydrogenophaga sp. 5NK40-0174]|uniref:hypothetical protein n=1 Tax=Hydrogenophaga sp. 5NK40-0174 TaxID=3127649 RepID=UPI003108C47F
MTLTTAFARPAAILTLAAVVLTGCGGDGDSDPVPAGNNGLGNIYLIGSDTFHPLDKVAENGTLLRLTDPNYGTHNPQYRSGDATISAWAIDTSAKGKDGEVVNYSMTVEAQSNVSGEALKWLQGNLRLNANTGLITQYCKGFPACYDNQTGARQVFKITAIAKIEGSSNSLKRSFQFVVLPKN